MEILLAGNTGYLTDEFLELAFPESHILVCGDAGFENKGEKLAVLKLREKHVIDLDLEHYDIDRIVYFSGLLTRQGECHGEIEDLCYLLEYSCSREIQVLYITGLQKEKAGNERSQVLSGMMNEVCSRYQKSEKIQLKILQSPYLYSSRYEKDWLYQIFKRMDAGKDLKINESGEETATFLYLDDLGELIFRIFDTWDQDERILKIPDVFSISWKEFAQALKKLKPETNIKTDAKDQVKTDNSISRTSVSETGSDDHLIREKYGWFPKISILEDLKDEYTKFEQARQKEGGRWEKLWNTVAGQTKLIKWTEIILFFLFSEILHWMLGNSAQFKYIDVRLLYVVITGTIYGLTEGIAAAFLAVCALTVSYIREGANGLTLFYEPSNWLPYILYFVVGAVCGYVQMKNRNDIAFANEENKLLKDKFLFVRGLYQDTVEEKSELKRQLLGRKDSFGKIFDITRKLDSERPEEIFLQTVRVLEEVLENHSIQIYSFGKNPYFARLEAASKEIAKTTPHSLRVEDYEDAVSAVEQDGMWVNRELKKEYPMYLTGIKKEGRLVLLISVRHASYEQMTLYYQNLVKILCGLVETALLRALNYQDALYEERHIDGTIFLKETYFLEKLGLYHSMSEEQMTEYTLLKLDRKQMTLEEASDCLISRIRESDTAGVNEEDEIYLILHQTVEKDAEIVIRRLEDIGFACQVIPRSQEGMK